MEVRSILFSVAFVVILALLEFTAVATAQESSTTEPIHLQINGTDGNNKAETTDAGGNQVGMIVGIIIGVLVALVIVAVLIVYLLRTKRFSSNKSEKDRAAQVQMTSARNAGVYVDLVTPGEKEAESPETEKLKRQEDEPEDV